MKKKLIIFGNGDIAEIAYFYFKTDSNFEVVAFTIDENFKKNSEFCGLPLVSYEYINKLYPPDLIYLFIAIGYSHLNSLRKEKFLSAKEKGYSLVSYISSKANILNDGYFGENCFILENNVIQPQVKLGSNITLWSGNHIGHHSIIGDHTFIASHSVISGRVNIGEQCFIGVNATIRDHINVGDRCVIGAGSLVLSDAESDGVYVGITTVRSKVPSYRLRGI